MEFVDFPKEFSEVFLKEGLEKLNRNGMFSRGIHIEISREISKGNSGKLLENFSKTSEKKIFY